LITRPAGGQLGRDNLLILQYLVVLSMYILVSAAAAAADQFCTRWRRSFRADVSPWQLYMPTPTPHRSIRSYCHITGGNLARTTSLIKRLRHLFYAAEIISTRLTLLGRAIAKGHLSIPSVCLSVCLSHLW